MTIALDAALSGLKAAQRSLDTISNNVANADTIGYTRKILPQENLIINGVGVGVHTGAITRNIDVQLQHDLFKQTSVSQGYNVTQTYFDQIQSFHGASETNNSLSSTISALKQSFSELSAAPDNTLALSKTLTAAQMTVRKFNDFSTLLTKMRNQTEDDISSAVTQVNQALATISEINKKVDALSSAGQSTAELDDQRDNAIQTVSKYLEISSYKAENGKIVIMTKQGQTLADENPRTLVFNKSNLLPTTYYPGGGADGLYIDSTSGIDITQTGVGGALGALLQMRDAKLPQYQAQIDEMAQKLAYRFNQEGLKLFTDSKGNVPANVVPPAVVGYIGFAAQIQVNTAVVADPTLLRSGTNGNVVAAGSNEVIHKITQFAFGDYEYQEARGTANIALGTLFTSLGLTQSNRIIGNINLNSYVPDFGAASGLTLPAQFQLTIGAAPPYTITVPIGETAASFVTNINTVVGAPIASLNGLGQISLNTAANTTIADISTGASGIAALGLSFGAFTAQNPSFSVQVGTQALTTINITAADTAASLLTTLNTIPGLVASLGGSGELVLRPTEGGDITLRNVIGQPLQSLGMGINNITHTAFRQSNMGPDATLSTGLLSNPTLEDFSNGLIALQSEDASLNKSQAEKENSFLETLTRRNSDVSGVNIDQELSELIRVQSAYTAAAKMISSSQKLFDDLLAAFR